MRGSGIRFTVRAILLASLLAGLALGLLLRLTAEPPPGGHAFPETVKILYPPKGRPAGREEKRINTRLRRPIPAPPARRPNAGIPEIPVFARRAAAIAPRP